MESGLFDRITSHNIEKHYLFETVKAQKDSLMMHRLDQYIKVLCLVDHSTRGSLWQTYASRKLGLNNEPGNKKHDATLSSESALYAELGLCGKGEMKFSLCFDRDKCANFGQVRIGPEYSDIEWYLLVHILADKNTSSMRDIRMFILNKNEVIFEYEKKSTSMHLPATIAAENPNKEIKLTPKSFSRSKKSDVIEQRNRWDTYDKWSLLQRYFIS